MKKVFLPIVVCAAMAMTANAVEPGNANIYASGLKVVNEGSDVQFVLNAPGDVTINFYKDGKKVESIEKTGLEKGLNTVSLAGVFGDDVKENDQLTWEVVATATANESVITFSDVTKPELGFYTPNDVVVDNNPESKNFGRIYVSNGEVGSKNGRTSELGIYILDATLSDVTEQGATAYAGGITWITAYSSPFRLELENNGELFISDWSESNSGVYIMDTNNPTADFRPVFGGTRNSSGVASEDGVDIHGSILAICITGEGEERMLYTYDEDYTDGGETKIPLCGYKIGELETPWVAAPTWTYANGSQQNANFNKTISGAKYVGDMTEDKRGGFWVSQYRGAKAETHPGLVHFNANGEIDFRTDIFVDGGQNYAFGINEKGDKIVHASSTKIYVGTISYDENNIPEITLDETLSNEFSEKYGAVLGNRMSGVAFDVADNVYISSYSYSIVGAYALPKAENTYTTPANDVVVVSKTMTGIEEIATENAPVEYYNLQGVKVNAPENGIFIRKQGAKTTKVVL